MHFPKFAYRNECHDGCYGWDDDCLCEEGMAEAMGAQEQKELDVSKVSVLEKKFEELLKKRHGIDDKKIEENPVEGQPMPEAFSSPEFFTAIMTFIDELPDEKEGSSSEGPFNRPQGPLENVVIEGDRATATVGGEPGGFVHVDGRWYFDLAMGMDQALGGDHGKNSQEEAKSK